MCGICGKIRVHAGKPVDESLIWSMSESLGYRGPDDKGVVIRQSTGSQNRPVLAGLGHRRLSILDLSSAGHQPMSNEDETLWITYNGEIYNFTLLKDQLLRNGHRFKSNTDTEVILHAYEEYGVKAVHQFNGMFAFGLWDEKTSSLWLCRDRVGIKPLVYYQGSDFLAFASEIKALLCDPEIPRELDEHALMLYLTFNYVPAPFTMFKGIRKLEPGHSLIWNNGILRIETYWDVPRVVDPEVARLSFSEQENRFTHQLYETVSHAVNSHLIADVPVGAFLSGGIDSSIVTALMARHSSRQIKTFSIGFRDDPLFDETRYARAVARHYHTDHYEFKLSASDMNAAVPEILSALDEPFADSSAIPTYLLSRETRNHVTVALSGDGGDELFAGYRYHLGEYWYPAYQILPEILRKNVIERWIDHLPDSRETWWTEMIRRAKRFIKSAKDTFPERIFALRSVFPESLQYAMMRRSSYPLLEHPGRAFLNHLLKFCPQERINSMLYADFKDALPSDMLTKVDAMSMRHSLEVRVPLLDHRVVELAFSMPGHLKLHQRTPKYIFKQTFKHLLPPLLHSRPKSGFEIPVGRWLKGELKWLLSRYLSEDRIRDQGLFEYRMIRPLIENHLDSRTDNSWMLWNLIVFQYWYERM